MARQGAKPTVTLWTIEGCWMVIPGSVEDVLEVFLYEEATYSASTSLYKFLCTEL